MADILNVLKRETREWHTRVESLVPVFDKGFTIKEYGRLLERFYGFYVRFERSLWAAKNLDEALPDWRDRRKVAWLEADLLWLGRDRSDLARLAVFTEEPPVSALARIMGALYVTEGSTLGGQVICRHLERSLQLLPGKGATFFYGFGEQTGTRWKTFARSIGAVACGENEREIVNSATQTFKAIAFWLSGQDTDEGRLGDHEPLETQAS